MSALPRGWIDATLGELGTWTSGGTPSRKTPAFFGGPIPWVKTGDLNDGFLHEIEEGITEAGLKHSSAKLFAPGTLLVAMYGATIGKTGVLVRAAATNQACAALLAEGPTREIMHYVWWYVRARLGDLKALGQGGAQPNISQTLIKSFPISLAPLAEQRHIVAKLEALFVRTRRAREELERAPNLIEHHRRALLRAAYSGAITSDWRAANEADDARTLELASTGADFAYGSSAKSSESGEVPVLRMGNIQDGKLDWTDLVYTSDAAEAEKYRLHSGDVLFNRTNSPELVGKTALYTGDRPAIYAGYLIRVRCDNNLVPAYLTYCLNSPAGRAYCWHVKTDGVSQSNINAKKLGAFPLRVPSRTEQNEIVRRLETAFAWLDKVAAEHAKAVALLPKLEAAMLAKAFRGELVPQDPNNEPASVLLERIRAARAAAEPPKRKREKLPPSKKPPKTTGKPKTRQPRAAFDGRQKRIAGM